MEIPEKFIEQPLRLVVVKTVDRVGNPIELWLLTDRLDLPAELVNFMYNHDDLTQELRRAAA